MDALTKIIHEKLNPEIGPSAPIKLSPDDIYLLGTRDLIKTVIEIELWPNVSASEVGRASARQKTEAGTRRGRKGDTKRPLEITYAHAVMAFVSGRSTQSDVGSAVVQMFKRIALGQIEPDFQPSGVGRKKKCSV